MRVFRIDVGTGAYQEVRPEGAGAEGALVWVDLDLTDITTPERFKELGSIGLPEAPPLYFELVARWHAPDEPAFTSEDFLHWDADEAATVNTPGGPRMITAPYVDVNVPIGIEVSQAGFDGDLERRVIRPAERRTSEDAKPEEVPRRVEAASRSARV